MYANVLHKPTVGLSLPYSLPRTFAQCHDVAHNSPVKHPRWIILFPTHPPHPTPPHPRKPKDSKTQRAEAKSCARVAQDARMRLRLPSLWPTLSPSFPALHIHKPTSSTPSSPLTLQRSPKLSLQLPAPCLLKVLSL